MTTRLEGTVPRRLEVTVRSLMAVEPVLVLQGPRSVGKSTLLQELAASAGREVLDLDDIATREAVGHDPAFFVGGDAPVFIDEYQHVPEVLDAIKAELNRDTRPGRFVITGSTNYLTLPLTARTLTGRAHVVDVLPLSQGEIVRGSEDFASWLINDPRSLVSGSSGGTTREGYAARAIAGGFPPVLSRARSADRSRWFDDYLELVIERDVLELSRIRQRQQLPRLLSRLASQTGGLLNIASAANSIQMEESTAENYTKLLEAVFLIRRLPAWGTTLGSRVGAVPKVHILDSGVAARLLNLTEEKLIAATPQAVTEFGHLLETFVVGEIIKQLGWLDEPIQFGHWRTHDGDEVDLVVERSDGSVIAMEVMAGTIVRGRKMTAIRKLKSRLGASFAGGIVLYTGREAHPLGDDIAAVPIDRLWRAAEL